jgi:hypothetical protein
MIPFYAFGLNISFTSHKAENNGFDPVAHLDAFTPLE